MSKDEYWEEALEIALEDEGASNALTKEQISNIAGALAVSAENEGMAMGHDTIPNPMTADVNALKRELRKAEEEAEKRERIYQSGIARLKNVRPEQVHIDHGQVMIWRD